MDMTKIPEPIETTTMEVEGDWGLGEYYFKMEINFIEISDAEFNDPAKMKCKSCDAKRKKLAEIYEKYYPKEWIIKWTILIIWYILVQLYFWNWDNASNSIFHINLFNIFNQIFENIAHNSFLLFLIPHCNF